MDYQKPFRVHETGPFELCIFDADDRMTTIHRFDHQHPDDNHPMVIEARSLFDAFVKWQCDAMNAFPEPDSHGLPVSKKCDCGLDQISKEAGCSECACGRPL